MDALCETPNMQTILRSTTSEAHVNRSENINELAAALAKAQGDMANASKDKTNPHFKSSYADLASIWDAIRGPLSKHGLAVLQMPFEDDKGRISLETMISHSSGQFLSTTYCLPPTKGDVQGFGSAITYMKRYALTGLGVAPEDDDGNAASERTLPQSSPYTSNPAPRNGNGNGDPKAAATKWAKDAIILIKSFSDMADICAWEGRNERAMEKLQNTDAKLHEDIMGVLADRYSQLNPLSAG
jgi:hypothetical protein